jgi:hypothetical protein
MTTLSLFHPAAWLPTREEVRAMLRHPAVAITAMVLAFLLSVVLVGAVVFLAWAGRDSTVINTMITAASMGLAGMLGARWRAKGTGGTDA